MKRIKDISGLRLGMCSVLLKITFKESKISAPGRDIPQPLVDYAEVVSVSSDISDLKVGDIVLDFKAAEGFEYKGDKYAVVSRMNVKMAVDRDNFTFGKKLDGKLMN